MNYKNALVIGGSSGIGADIVRILYESGTKVAVVGRDEPRLLALQQEKPELVFPFIQDVCTCEDPGKYIADIALQLGGLDIVIYSAGLLLDSPDNKIDLEKAKLMIDVNYRAAVLWLTPVAERFMQVKSGSIVGIGSVAGDRGRKDRPVYNSSKAAFHTFLESLRNLTFSSGVTVVTIKPGPVDTPMTKDIPFSNKMPSRVAAEKIMKLSDKSGEHYLLLSHLIIFNIIKIVPSWIFRRLKI